MVLRQIDLIRFCEDAGWNPFFLVESEDGVDRVQHQLHREIEVALASQHHQMVQDMLSYLSKNDCNSLALELCNTYADALRSIPTFLRKGRVGSSNRVQSLDILRRCLDFFEVKSKWLSSDSRGDLAQQCGREMKYLRNQERHEVVVQLGELAEKLLLRHPLVDANLRISNQSIKRANERVILAAFKDSPHRSRSDYEAAILDAWLADPDCSEYLELLRKVVSYKLRKKSSLGRLDAFESERVDHAINQRLWRRLDKVNELASV